MCYQKFVTFTCGCGTLEIDEPCEYATHPFSIRYLCPDYTSDSEWSIHACGRGDWWCAGSKDADYIYDLFRLYRDASAKCEQLNKEQQELKQDLQSLKATAQRKAIPDHLFKSHPHINRLNLQYTAKADQCNDFLRRSKMAVTFIEEVKQFYFRYGGPHSQHQVFSKAPSFLDAVGPRVAKSVTPVLLNTNRSATPTQFPIGGNHVVKRISSLLAQQAVKHEEHAQSGARPQQVKKQATPLKRKRKSLSPAKSEVEEEKPAVRRSNRVSNKNVNYEESDGSSPARAVSPGESDVSGFDPSNRSDISASPDQSPPRRKREKPALQSQSTRGGGPKVGIGSFSSSMDDYLERLSRITSPANARSRPQTTTIPHGTENATRRDNSLLRPPQHYRIPHVTQAFPNVAISHSRPPTRHGPPNDQQSNSSIGDVAQPPATPNFFSNQQTPQVMPHQSFLPTNHAHNIREDTNQLSTNRLMGFPPRNNFLSQGGVSSSTVYGHIVPAQSPYDRMRLSFSATADLTPPPTSTEATPLTTDPKKRKQPVSSPLQTTNKRPRLSFPGDDFPNNAPTLLKQIPSRSSPSRMQAEATAGHHQDMPYKEQLNQLSTPAPNLAPTAVMYQPSLRPDQVSIVTNGGQDGQVGVVEDGYNDESFDALIEEDKFSTELPEFIFG